MQNSFETHGNLLHRNELGPPVSHQTKMFCFRTTSLFRFFFSLWCYLMFIEWFTGQITAGSVCKRVFRCSSVAFENCFADHISSRRFLLIYLRLLLFKKEKVIMCFRIGIFWFVFNVLASFLAYRIYSFNHRARALIRGVHYVIIPKKISHWSLRKGMSNFTRIEKTQIKFWKFHV